MAIHLRHSLGDQILGQYRVTTVLGSGAHGTVYQTTDEAGQPHAVKEMHVFEDPLAAEQGLEYFRREAAALARLNHPGIPRAAAFDLAGPVPIDPRTGIALDPAVAEAAGAVMVPARYYLVMDFVDGQSLELLARYSPKGLPPADVASWVRQLGAALGYLHQQGLVHRDVKPQNVLVRRGDRAAILIDFGLCRPACAVAGYGTVPMSSSGRFGTLGYAPPDPVEQENPVPSSDQHALAMTARRLLTGLDPTRPDHLALLRGSRLLDLCPDVDPLLAAALDRGIRPLAAERFPSVAALLSAMDARAAAPLGRPRVAWVEITPEGLDAGSIAPGQLRDLHLTLRDRRPGVSPRGYAMSNDDRLRILPATRHGETIRLHLLLKVPRQASEGPVETTLVVTANDEEHTVKVRYVVDPAARPNRRLMRLGCALLPVSWLTRS